MSEPLTPAQIGILKDIQELRVDLDQINGWMREQLAQIIFRPGALLIDSDGPSVYLTTAGETYLRTVLQSNDPKVTGRKGPKQQ